MYAGILLLLLTTSFASVFQVSPSEIRVGEDRAILFQFSLDCEKEECPSSVELREVDPETKKVKTKWQLQQDKKFANKYDRIVYFKEKKPGALSFEINEHKVKVTVLPRPTFLELVKAAWAKLTKR